MDGSLRIRRADGAEEVTLEGIDLSGSLEVEGGGESISSQIAEAIANALEHPFGLELNQLNLSTISSVIDRTTGEILGVPPIGDTPEPNT